jgi:hypothetical protein
LFALPAGERGPAPGRKGEEDQKAGGEMAVHEVVFHSEACA